MLGPGISSGCMMLPLWRHIHFDQHCEFVKAGWSSPHTHFPKPDYISSWKKTLYITIRFGRLQKKSGGALTSVELCWARNTGSNKPKWGGGFQTSWIFSLIIWISEFPTWWSGPLAKIDGCEKAKGWSKRVARGWKKCVSGRKRGCFYVFSARFPVLCQLFKENSLKQSFYPAYCNP